MIFYKRMIGDIQAKTGDLSCAEMGIHDRFLDHYYSLEEPLPADMDVCFRIARAMTKEERRGVEKILAKFFFLTVRGYEQRKVEEMIADALPKIEASRINGRKGGRPKTPKQQTQNEPIGLFPETHRYRKNEPNGQASQSQSQSQSQRIGIQSGVVIKKGVCVSPHTHFSEEFRTAAKVRQDLDAECVWENFCSYYPLEKLTLPRWKQWLKNERIANTESSPTPSVSDPDSRASVEAVGISLGLGTWTETEQWASYKSRVFRGASHVNGCT